MSAELNILVATAATLAFVHTLLGPDHYVPFVMMSRAGQWSRAKTTWVTLACGVGHVMSSVVLGLVGIALGLAVSRLQLVESVRDQFAAWALLAFGLVYFVWGVTHSLRNRPHTHGHMHEHGQVHHHEHRHWDEHMHVHASTGASATSQLTPWLLFTIFVSGPCKPLIPLLMYPAARKSLWGLGLITVVFSVTTIATMVVMVLLASRGLKLLPLGFLERHMHALAGATISICGAAILFLGL